MFLRLYFLSVIQLFYLLQLDCLPVLVLMISKCLDPCTPDNALIHTWIKKNIYPKLTCLPIFHQCLFFHLLSLWIFLLFFYLFIGSWLCLDLLAQMKDMSVRVRWRRAGSMHKAGWVNYSEVILGPLRATERVCHVFVCVGH